MARVDYSIGKDAPGPSQRVSHGGHDNLLQFLNALQHNVLTVYLVPGLSLPNRQDAKKAQSTTERLIELYRQQDQSDKAIEKMKSFLPGGSIYILGGDLPDAMDTLKTLASLQEQRDKEFFDREVKARRGRLSGGTLEQVQAAVRRDLYTNSEVSGVGPQ